MELDKIKCAKACRFFCIFHSNNYMESNLTIFFDFGRNSPQSSLRALLAGITWRTQLLLFEGVLLNAQFVRSTEY